MGVLIPEHVDAQRLITAAASSAAAAVVYLIEIGRGGEDHADGIRHRETTVHLADALQSALSIELEALVTAADGPAPTDRGGQLAAILDTERKEAVGQLLAAVSRFLEGWA